MSIWHGLAAIHVLNPDVELWIVWAIQNLVDIYAIFVVQFLHDRNLPLYVLEHI